MSLERVVIVGGPGSGKTTLARRLAAGTGADHVELDELWWTRPGWVHAEPHELRRALAARTAEPGRWVVDGNYLEEVADDLWPRADAVVWLDLPRRRAVARAMARSARRVVTRERLWHGNRERPSVLSPRSILRLWRRWPGYGERVVDEARDRGICVIRLRSADQVDRWLAENVRSSQPDRQAAEAAGPLDPPSASQAP